MCFLGARVPEKSAELTQSGPGRPSEVLSRSQGLQWLLAQSTAWQSMKYPGQSESRNLWFTHPSMYFGSFDFCSKAIEFNYYFFFFQSKRHCIVQYLCCWFDVIYYLRLCNADDCVISIGMELRYKRFCMYVYRISYHVHPIVVNFHGLIICDEWPEKNVARGIII